MMIETSMQEYMTLNPKLKYIFFGGKGQGGQNCDGRGSSHVGCPTGQKTLLASTNPVHSLSSLLGQDVFGKPTPVTASPI
jgi:arsenite-transporting ATPase